MENTNNDKNTNKNVNNNKIIKIKANNDIEINGMSVKQH
jgi:hypothetical protein